MVPSADFSSTPLLALAQGSEETGQAGIGEIARCCAHEIKKRDPEKTVSRLQKKNYDRYAASLSGNDLSISQKHIAHCSSPKARSSTISPMRVTEN